jgi:cytochrome d ubiquinol oxidase subunit II
VVILFASAALFSGIHRRLEFRAFAGSCLLIAGLLGAGAVSIFPVMLRSTLGSEYSLTAYNSAASRESLAVAAIWWPIALVLAVGYFLFILRHFRGRVKPPGETERFY